VRPLELARVRWDVADPAPSRLARAGGRAAGVGATMLATASRLRRIDAAGSAGRRERARVLRDAARRALQLHGLEVRATGPLPLGPALLASNHVSWLDPLVVASLIPCAPVSKLDVSRWPLVGGLARDLGVVFVARGDARSGASALRQARAALEHGVPVLNFPEATTTPGTSVLPFRAGAFGLAIAAGVPVVPVALRYDPPELAWVGEDSFVPHWLRLASSRRASAYVALGEPMQPTANASAATVARAVHAEVSRLLQELR
jgi:1-acyl-sn-glycerol-3-phosphate acyltransferase